MTSHVGPALLDAFAAGDRVLPPDVAWAVESHLDACAACRAHLGEAVARLNPATLALVERVGRELAVAVDGSAPTPVRRRRLPSRSRWLAPAMLPRLATTALVVAAAVALDLAGSGGPSLVLLVAPVAPLLGVAAAWSRGIDPAHELVVSSPRAGLELVLRRTVVVLLSVIPLLGAAGWVVGAAPALWLLPCLACTAGALALGEFVGLYRAATGIAAAWALLVIAPSVALGWTPVVLAAASRPAWVVVTVVVAGLLILRRRAYTRLHSGQ